MLFFTFKFTFTLEISFCNWKKMFSYLIRTNSKWPLMNIIWLNCVQLLVDTALKMSTVADADNYGLTYSPLIYSHV